MYTYIMYQALSVKVVRLWNERKGVWEDGSLERERERERERETLLGNNDNEPSGFQ